MTSIRTKKTETVPAPVTTDKKDTKKTAQDVKAKVDTKAPVKVATTGKDVKKPEAPKKEVKPAPKK